MWCFANAPRVYLDDETSCEREPDYRKPLTMYGQTAGESLTSADLAPGRKNL